MTDVLPSFALLSVTLLGVSPDPKPPDVETAPLIVRPETRDNFEAYRPNYFLLGDREDQVLFQFSFRYNLWPTNDRFNYFLAYTQRSWWRLYEFDDSSPFTENNYSPEFFVRWRFRRARLLGEGFDQLQLGYQHESNGLDSVESRSWDRLYVEQRFVHYFGRIARSSAAIQAYVRLWLIFARDPFNRDIDDFMGPGELIVNVSSGESGLGVFEGELLLRKGGYDLSFERGAAQVGLRWVPPWAPSVRFTPGIYLQGFVGYGQSLLRYDVRDDALRIGVFFDR